jgi:hypothetical protein
VIEQNMDENTINLAIILPIFGTLVATIISSAVATIVSILINKKSEKERFELQLQNLIQLSIQYPYLENRTFSNSWNPNNIDDEKYQRYENYCTLVFNYISELFSWVKHKKDKLEKHIDVKNWVRIHKKCWENPSFEHENSDVYDKVFVDLIDSYMR